MLVSQMISLVRGLGADQKGVTAIEYGVIAAATVVTIVVALTAIGPKMTTIFTSISSAL